MQKNIYIVDAFTDELYAGNPAGVVLDSELIKTDQMQKIAKELNLSETAFVLPGVKNKYDIEIRFFTPTEEVDLCGHATIATFFLLNKLNKLPLNKKIFKQKTKAGILDVKLEDENVIMKQANPKKIDKIFSVNKLAQVMNIDICDIGSEHRIGSVNLSPEIWSTGLEDILLPVKSQRILKNMKPHMESLAGYTRELDVVGVHAFYFNDSGEIICRNFAPAYGIPEESATGTSNGALGGYLACKSHNNVFFTAKQGDVMDRSSRIFVRANYEPLEVWVGGKARVVMEGKINIK